ncbi:Mini-ribonuclease 3 [Pelotomaculum schinkii]|uniref:Mini-ribonuclease 3 n=1 Tax=Pelotomaculum schinkii TaxID=78350 RepID=A0A4Y7RH33_9FIRM|nr:ribonuclease III domain-containing protein [Pelotomaculum schinkii]TEB08315.1 Mini-ribonuclease 3 [Pelotomaculum schinkii]
MKNIQPGELPALALAYIGDAVYELAVRSHLVESGISRVKRLHDEAVKYVHAKAQARLLRELEGILTEEETAVIRRGRNAKSPHTPRSAGVIDYRQSTAFECLIGYLYLKGDKDRLEEILALALEMGRE